VPENPSATPLALPEVLLLEPRVFEDARGTFFEAWNAAAFADLAGDDLAFVQDNHSTSSAGVLRGLHYQLPPSAQGKLVRVIAGSAFDVVVDVRRSSPRFGQWASIELSSENRHQVWIPSGFAHGLLALSDRVEVLYKVTGFHDPASEQVVRWDDPAIGIDWPLATRPILSERDRSAPALADAAVFD